MCGSEPDCSKNVNDCRKYDKLNLSPYYFKSNVVNLLPLAPADGLIPDTTISIRGIRKCFTGFREERE